MEWYLIHTYLKNKIKSWDLTPRAEKYVEENNQNEMETGMKEVVKGF